MMKSFDQMYEEMEREIELVKTSQTNMLDVFKSSIGTASRYVNLLKETILSEDFENDEQEIAFFKSIKPKFYSHLIYFNRLLAIEALRPPGTRQVQEDYLRQEQDKITAFFNQHREFFKYIRSGSILLDSKMFLRREQETSQLFEAEDFDKDKLFTTSHDLLVARLLACEMLANYLENEIRILRNAKQNDPEKHPLNWTGSKASLTELVYALYSCGVFNYGNTTLQQIASKFENLCNVQLGNYYRSFQEIRIRKKNRTQFIDELKERLTQKMDYDDEHPR